MKLAVTGCGATFRRDLDAWVVYTMPGCREFAQLKGFDAPVGDVVTALRSSLSKVNGSEPKMKLDELAQYTTPLSSEHFEAFANAVDQKGKKNDALASSISKGRAIITIEEQEGK